MKIHLLRSEELSINRFFTIVELINQYKGPIKFLAANNELQKLDANSVEETDSSIFTGKGDVLKTLLWTQIYEKCDNFRLNNKIKDDDTVILLSDHPNEQNWFSHWDNTGKKNFYVHTANWEFFVLAESWFPIVYEIASIPFGLVTCNNLKELIAAAHDEPRGCVLDYCKNKSQVQLRLRTADICPDCYNLMIKKKVDPRIASQIFAIFEGMRSHILYRNRFQFVKQRSRLEINVAQRLLIFKDPGDLSVRFSPLEMTFYLFFMKHSEGVLLTRLSDYRQEVLDLYMHFVSTPNLTKINATIDLHVEYNSQALSGVFNSIQEKLDGIANNDIIKPYSIAGSRGEKRYIPLERELFTLTGELGGRVRLWFNKEYKK